MDKHLFPKGIGLPVIREIIARSSEQVLHGALVSLDERMHWNCVDVTIPSSDVFLDLQRKIVQSPNKLFPEDTASAEERQLLELVKSFKTIEEKQKFFNIVEQAYNQTKCTQA